ncbi:MAG: phenylalanine--tRNA ligase subunit alpha [Bacillota bacterium]
MREELKRLKEEALAAIEETATAAGLQDLRVKYLGKKGALTGILRGMGAVPADERPALGQLANEARDAIEARLTDRATALESTELDARLGAEKVDLTLPGTWLPRGSEHPMSLVIEEVKAIFTNMGFQVVDGPEVETDYYNFEALNIPKDHPARDTQDSFFINPEILLRTQTSPVQIRTMEKMAPRLPVRIITIGRVYRRDESDPTHGSVFHQLEGLVVDRGITMGDLKGTLTLMARSLFGEDVRIRLRPSYFPFTEPSCESDVSCPVCDGAGCRVCKGTGWIELGGSGMVHPHVLVAGGYDPEVVSGFAWGFGIERMTMRKYGIEDLRHLYANDVRFLRQF